MSIKSRPTKRTLKTLEKITGEELTFGRLLWAIRQCDEISQTAFAQKLGISRQKLCDIEHRRRFVSPKMAAYYANRLGYSAEQFVRLCVQDILEKDGVKATVDIKLAQPQWA